LQDLEFRQLVERIKLRSPIEEVVGDRVQDLRKKGALFWARCPFHEERTPSFAVDPRRGTWRCFGACGEGGDVISFLQRFDGVSFLEGLELLASACGEEIPDLSSRRRSSAEREHTEQLHVVLDRAGKFYAKALFAPQGARALEYIRKRGIEETTLAEFGVGWAAARGNPVLDAAVGSGFTPDLLAEVGLIRHSEDGRPYDFFRGRLMVPIRDRLGRTLGFGGRRLPGDQKALGKYVNTPETRLFHKGRLIYGLDLAADAVRKSRHIVLVEGYTDVMAAHQCGLRNVAAILGTSTTDDHAALVRRSGANRITLVFDGDEAGRKASARALVGLLPLGRTIEVASPPAGKDPCDLLIEEGSEAFGQLIEGARPWFDWAVEELRDLGGSDLAEGVDRLFELVIRLPKPVEREARLVELAGALSVSADAVLEQWRGFRGRKVRDVRTRPVAHPGPGAPGSADRDASTDPEAEDAGADDAPDFPSSPAPDRAELAAFRALMGALLLDNSLIPLHRPLAERCPEGELHTIFHAVCHLYEHGDPAEPVDAAAVMNHLGEDPARDAVVALEILASTAESPQALAHDQERWLMRRAHEREFAVLRHQLLRPPGLLADEGASEDLLKSLHEQMKSGRVPAPSSDSRG
jgi:DNA primase